MSRLSPGDLTRVLYVDDSAFDRALVRDSLEVESGDFHLTEASSREELEVVLAREWSFDLVLSDFNIMGMTGLDVVTLVRSVAPDVPIIIVTGTGSEEIAVEALKSGVDDYVIKQPTHVRRLPETIRTVLQTREARQERDRARALLEESELRFRLMAEHSADLILRLDSAGRILYASPSAAPLLGMEPERLVGRRLSGFVADDERDLVVGQLAAATGEFRVPPFRLRGRRPPEVHWVEVRGRVLDEAMAMSGQRELQLTCRDVTDRKVLEESLETSREKLRQLRHLESVSRLAGGIAHDFNNLLTVISGNIELLHDELAETHPLMEEVEEIRRAARRAGDLTRHLLEFSSGEVAPTEAVDVADLLEETEGILRRGIGEDIQLEIEVSDDLEPIESNPARLQQVLLNLAFNARDAIRTGAEQNGTEAGLRDEWTSGAPGAPGRVRLEVDRLDPDPEEEPALASWLPGRGTTPLLRIRVSDNGCGMPPEIMERVFEPFFTTKEVGKGTGLGLASSFGTVRQAGGTILVDSEPGGGSTFTVLLPFRS